MCLQCCAKTIDYGEFAPGWHLVKATQTVEGEMDEGDYKELRKFDYFQVTDILFSHYGEDKNTASIYVQFDDKVVRLKPCNGFQSLNKRCSLKGKCSIPASGLMVIQEPKG